MTVATTYDFVNAIRECLGLADILCGAKPKHARAVCHPSRGHCARGLCTMCYQRLVRAERAVRKGVS